MVDRTRHPSYGFAVLCVVLLTCCRSAQAQEGLVFDPASGTYTIDYVDDSGEERTLEVVPPNRVSPEIELTSIAVSNGGWLYEYAFHNQMSAASDQQMFIVELGCPPSVATPDIQSPPGWRAQAKVSGQTGRYVCEFIHPTAGIAPGTMTSGFRVTSDHLPLVAEIAVWGGLPDTQDYPGLVESRPGLIDLVSTVNGIDGGWYEGTAVLPAISPDDLADPVEGIGVLQPALTEACARGLIDNSNGVCHSLEVKLQQAEASIVADRPAARHQVQAFLNELEAQRGQHVTESAYWLLTALGEHVLSTI